MTNWRTTLGGALGTLGTSLTGIGTVTAIVQFNQPGEVISTLVIWTMVTGFFISAVGKFFTALWAADAKTVGEILDKQSAIIQGHTDQLSKTTPPT